MTRVAVLTPAGTAAIATVAVHGEQAWAIVRRLFRPAGKPLPESPVVGRTWFGTFGGAAGDEVVVAVPRDPVTVEVHCHGGRRVVRWVVARLVEAGCVEADWRVAAFAPSVADPRAALELPAATTLKAAAVLLDQLHGSFAGAVEQILASPTLDGLADLSRHADLGSHLTMPWRVVVAGPPNVGKSSLINALAGYQRSIVAPVAGTTRDVVRVQVALAGWPVELSDTAGLRDATADPLEAAGIGSAKAEQAVADLVVWVLDGSAAEPARFAGSRPVLVVVNKADAAQAWVDSEPAAVHRVSAATGQGVADLADRIIRTLIPVDPPAGTPVPFTPALAHAVRTAAQHLAADDPAAARETLTTVRPTAAASPRRPSSSQLP